MGHHKLKTFQKPLFALANKSCTAYAFCFMIVTLFPEVYYKITGPSRRRFCFYSLRPRQSSTLRTS